jgi:hypothetical protein
MPLITCPDCGTQVSDQAPACVKCGRPIGGSRQPLQKSGAALRTWLSLLALGALGYFFLTGGNPLDLLKSLTAGVQAYVECEGTFGGMACRVTRRAGRGPATACWDVEFACANGTTASAHACHEVPAGIGSMSPRSIGWNEFANYDRCDQVVTSRVLNLALTH